MVCSPFLPCLPLPPRGATALTWSTLCLDLCQMQFISSQTNGASTALLQPSLPLASLGSAALGHTQSGLVSASLTGWKLAFR